MRTGMHRALKLLRKELAHLKLTQVGEINVVLAETEITGD